jgi:hypothetical protein
LSSSARDSSSSRTLCIRFSNCLSRAISACASWRRSSGFICGRERSNWDSSVRAQSTFCGEDVRCCHKWHIAHKTHGYSHSYS